MEILPKEINHIIISYISLDDQELIKLLEIYPEFKWSQWLFHQLFELNFPGLYPDVFQLEDINWYDYYLELIRTVPDIKEISLYEDDTHLTREYRDNVPIEHRSQISDKYILDSIGQFELPDFIFKALFKKHFPDTYKQLIQFKDLKYKNVYIIYRISYSSLTDDKNDWYILAEDGFRNYVDSMLDDINTNLEVLDIILNDPTVKKFLEDVFEEDMMNDMVLNGDNNELFKYLYEKYSVDITYGETFLGIARDAGNEELVEFLEEKIE